MLGGSFDFAQDDGAGTAAEAVGMLGASAAHHPAFGHHLPRRRHIASEC